MTGGRLLIDVFDDLFRHEATMQKGELEKAIIAVRAARQLLADEPSHAIFVEVELAHIGEALRHTECVLVRALRRFDQLSPETQAAMRSINTRFRHILTDLVRSLASVSER